MVSTVATYETTANKLKMLGHPIRLQILDMLRQGEICVCHIENALNKRQAYISQQLMVLRDAGLIQPRKDGLRVYYSLADEEVKTLLNTIFGQADEELTVLVGCPCPSCS